MRRAISSILIVPFLFMGCADKEAWKGYYQVEERRTQALIQAQKDANINARNARASEMAAFSQAMTAAAATPEATDDIAIALSWGFRLGQPEKNMVPTIQPVEAPDSTKDIWQGITPALGLVAPFLYPIAYGWSNSSGSTYTATDNAKINIRSENSGSGNTAGGNMTLTNTDSRQQLENDCLDCGDPDFGVAGTEVEPPGIGLEECLANPPGGYSPSGTPWLCQGCSCQSALVEGNCTCEGYSPPPTTLPTIQ